MLKLSLSKIPITAEHWVLGLVSLGLPAIAYLYFDWRAAFSVFIIVQIGINILRLKVS